jgi:hypothetical protein
MQNYKGIELSVVDPHHFGNLDPHPHQIKIRSRIRTRVISRIRIRINVMRIHNTELQAYKRNKKTSIRKTY